MSFATFYLRQSPAGRWELSGAAAAQFEVVRYSDGRGRVYHLPTERIAVDGAHVVGSVEQLSALLEQWLRDPLRRTIRYSAPSEATP